MKDRNSPNSISRKTARAARAARAARLPWQRRWLARIWLTYGGGLYAVGYALTFLYLEAQSILEEVFDSSGVWDFVRSHLIEFLFRFAVDSIVNMVQAFVWFLPWLSYRTPLGLILLGIGFYVFDIYLREPVGRWLLKEDDDTPL